MIRVITCRIILSLLGLIPVLSAQTLVPQDVAESASSVRAISGTTSYLYIVGNLFNWANVNPSGPALPLEYPVFWLNSNLNVLYRSHSAQYVEYQGWTTGAAVESDGNVYFSGANQTAYTIYGEGVSQIGQVWKNGTVVVSVNAPVSASDGLQGVAVDLSGNVYSYDGRPGYYKNQTFVSLETGHSTSGIAVDTSGNVYVSGTSNGNLPVYWINGALKACMLPAGSSAGRTTSVAVDTSGNVYVSGVVSIDSQNVPVYWGNGALNSLPLGGEFTGTAKQISVDANSNVYVLGSQGGADGYWMNANFTPLISVNGARFYCLVVDAAGTVYVGGSDNHNAGGPNDDFQYPAIWINGVETELSHVNYQWGFVSALAIGP
jgi:hypothetical protein